MRQRLWNPALVLLFIFLFPLASHVWGAAPTITSVSPTSGAVGASVTITGTNFGSTQGTSTVKFNGKAATVTSWGGTSIVAMVPTGATTGNVVVTVSSVASNGKSFTVVSAPSITSLSITTGAVGAAVTLTGTNFGSTQGSGTVKFNGTAATVANWNATTIAVTVPNGATTGNVVVFASGVNSNGKSFTVLPTPSIVSLSASSGTVGTEITISGTNFGSTQGTSTIKFNGTTATATNWSTTSIATTVPSGATTGNVVVTVSGVASNGVNFVVKVLTSIAVTPSSPALTAGNVQQFTATGTYSDLSTQNLTSTATWTSSVTPVATVNTSGLATAVAGGQTNIQAAVGTINGSTSLTVPGFTLTGSLGTARYGHTATVLSNGTVLIAGGYDVNSTAVASAELYNPATKTFAPTGSLNVARTNDTATLLDDGTVLIAGGFDINFNLLGSAEIYNPATGLFTVTGTLLTPRANHTATLLSSGDVLLAGSSDGSGNALANAEIYIPATQSFSAVGSLNAARGYHTAVALNDGTVLISGGIASGSVLASAELFNPSTGVFVPTGNLNNGRIQNTATLLNGGLVLVAGGKDSGFNILSSAELYNPATKTFALTGSLNTARGNHGAALLSNGTVLVEGGFGNGVDMSASAEVFDPIAQTFSPTSSLNVARQLATTTLLTNGLTLVAGGFSDSLTALNSAELYQPASMVPTNLVSIAVTPVSPSIPSGTALSFAATGTFTGNGTQTLASATWTSSNSSALTVSNDSSNQGVVAALTVGSASVTACAGAICGSTTATVIAPNPTILSLTPNSGPTGSSIVVNGEGFGTIEGLSTVTVDGILASASNWTPTAISVVVPAATTTGNVVVTVNGVSSNLVQFTVLPTPFISSVTPTSGDVVTCSPKSAHNRVRFPYSGVRAEHVEEQAYGGADDCCAEAMEAGRKAEDVAREVGVSKHTIYAWKAKYGGMDVSEAQEAKQLRDENTRLRKLVADLSLDKEALQSVIRKNGWSS